MRYQIGTKIKQLREDLGLNQTEFASMIGVSNSRVSNWEKGINRPDVDLLSKICEVLHVSADDLLELNNDISLNTREQILIKNYKELSNNGRLFLDNTLKNLIEYESSEKRQQAERKKEAELQYTKEESEEQPELYARRIRRGGVANNAPPIPKRGHKMTKLNHFEGTYGAGGGQINDTATMITIEVSEDDVPEGADTTIDIAGDSMEPTLSNGDVVYVQHTNQLEIGDIGVFYLDGQNFIKEYGGDELISHNPEYAPIQISEFSTFVIQGKVLGKKIEGFVEL